MGSILLDSGKFSIKGGTDRATVPAIQLNLILADPTTKITPRCGVIAAPLPHSTRYARMEALYSTVDS